MPDVTFKDLELQGWSEKADAYDTWFATVTQQAIAPMLDQLADDLSGKRLLDICCGTGHLTAAAAARGADAEGLDFADTMVAQSKANYPDLPFRTGDGEALDATDGSFDAVACAFGILHFSEPETGMAEACRVLKSGGRYGFTVWLGPDKGSEMMRLIGGSIRKHANLDIDLPEAPPMFKYSDPDTSMSALTNAGFADPQFHQLDLEWSCDKPEDVLEMIYKSIVRTPMVLERQSEEVRDTIHAEILERAEHHRRDGKIRLAFPAALFTATKP
jgi:ubiquinone/menaquinone biosynthesis C-methylase UbiE